MVSIRKQRRLSNSPPASNHDCSNKKANNLEVLAEEKRSNYSEEEGCDRESGGNVPDDVIGERREALMTGVEAFSVPAKKAGAVESTDAMTSPIDRSLQSKTALAIPTTRLTMSSIREQSPYKKRPRVDSQLEQDLEPDIEQRVATAGLNRGPDSGIPHGDMLLPCVQLQRVAARLDPAPGFMIPGRDKGFPAAVQLNGSLSRDGLFDEEDEHDGLAHVRKKKMSKIMSSCLAVDRDMTNAERMKYIFGSATPSKSNQQAGIRGRGRIRQGGRITAETSKSIVQAKEADSPPRAFPSKRPHFLRSSSSIVNSELDDEHPLRKPEGSLLHSLYLLLLVYGRGGILKEELLSSLHCQSLTTNLADDWEDDVMNYLNRNPHFHQVQGHYLLSKFLHCPSSNRLAKRKEKESLGSTIDFNQGCGGETSIQGTRKDTKSEVRKVIESKRLSKGKSQKESSHLTNGKMYAEMPTTKLGKKIYEFKEPTKKNSKWGTLKAMQAKIVAEHGVQVGARLCALRNKRPWQCPMMAIKDGKYCQHHTDQFKQKAKILKKSLLSL